MRGGAVAILVVLRCDGEEWALCCRQPRLPVGSGGFLEIPAGMLDGSGHFAGVAAKEMKVRHPGGGGGKMHALSVSSLVLSMRVRRRRQASRSWTTRWCVAPSHTPSFSRICRSHAAALDTRFTLVAWR
jgi:hypothetical protein